MNNLVKPFKFFTFQKQVKSNYFLNNRSGQAMIEYVLILIISVTMLFLAKGLFSNLNNYMSKYIGTYFKCLISQGELPALGVSDGDLQKHLTAGYKCSIGYEGTVVASGSANGSAAASNGSTKALSANQGSTAATAASRGGSTAGKSKKEPKKRNKSFSVNDNSSDDSNRFSSLQNRSEPYKTGDSADDDSGQVRSVPMAVSSEPRSSEKYRAVNGRLQESILNKTRGGLQSRRDNQTRLLSSNEESLRPGPRRHKLNPPTRAVASATEEIDTELGFGYFMKWIMIAGIGIVIFIFFGGQIMNYSNSDSN